jgi:hypothetical protein
MKLIVPLYQAVTPARTPAHFYNFFISEMNRIHKLILCVVILLHGQIFAQPPLNAVNKEAKSSLFSSLPSEFEVTTAQLQKIFSGNIHQQVSAQLSRQFFIEGIIVDKIQQIPGTISINVRLSNYHNALFNLSLRLQADNTTAFQGRIIHPKYNDVLILYKEKDKYYFKKGSQRLLMPD